MCGCRGVAAAFVAAALGCLCTVRGWAGVPDSPSALPPLSPAVPPSALLFTGTDLWRDGQFLYGGLLWGPAGLDIDGFTLKVLAFGGRYDYPTGGLGQTIIGTMASAAALPGWRFSRDNATVTLFAGAAVQDYRTTPYDPGARLRGSYAGGETAADIWIAPDTASMLAVSGSLTSIGPTGTLRAALGWRWSGLFFVGPEFAGYGCDNYGQFRIGAHITALRLPAPRLDGLEWSAASGFAHDSYGRSGPYLRLGVSSRY